MATKLSQFYIKIRPEYVINWASGARYERNIYRSTATLVLIFDPEVLNYLIQQGQLSVVSHGSYMIIVH
jgi:hypothetical protein